MVRDGGKYSRDRGSFAARIVVFLVVLAAVCAVIFSMSGRDGEQEAGTITFFSQFVVAGGAIVWFVLLPMSVVTLYLAVGLCLTISRKKLLPGGVAEEIATDAVKLGAVGLGVKIAGRGDLISRSVERTIIKSQYLAADSKHIQHLGVESIQEHAMFLLRRVEWCNIIGNVAPMVGLFGTVFGMIKAFNILGVAGGQPPADQLAAAISVALVTTFWGLLIAIPALTMHGVFRSRVESLASEAVMEVEVLLRQITVSEHACRAAAKKNGGENILPRTVMQDGKSNRLSIKTVS